MSFQHVTRLRCDSCGKVHGEYPGFATTRLARQAAKADGWKRVKHYRPIKSILGTKFNARRTFYQDHCPACLLTAAGQTEQLDDNRWSRIKERDSAA